MFLMASVSRGSKMYRTPAARETHSALHFGQKSSVNRTLLNKITLCSQDD